MDLHVGQNEATETQAERATPKDTASDRDTGLVPRTVESSRKGYERLLPRFARRGFFGRDDTENGHPTLAYLR